MQSQDDSVKSPFASRIAKWIIWARLMIHNWNVCESLMNVRPDQISFCLLIIRLFTFWACPVRKKFRLTVWGRTADAQNQYSPRMLSERPSGLCATPRPHQMPCGNATSHEYRADTFRVKTGVSKTMSQKCELVLLPVLKPQLWTHVNGRLYLLFVFNCTPRCSY